MSAADIKNVKRRKKKINPKQKRMTEQVERILELPAGSLSDTVRIELMGNHRAIVDGCRGIVEYSDGLVRIQTGDGMIRFTGSALSISCLTEDSSIIEGVITSLEYLS